MRLEGRVALITGETSGIDHGGQGIRVNAVCPGPMEHEDARSRGSARDEDVRIASEGRPIPQIGEPLGVAD